jgi:hypothetical protein
MAQSDRQHFALQTIFSFFLGLMVLAFIGVGVNTFYQQPSNRYQAELQPLYDRQNAIYADQKGGVEPTGAVAAELKQINVKIQAIQTKIDRETKGWSLNTSIILVVFATIVMGISLVRSEQLRVLSNGLLLGGLFTMLYGMGWTVASDTSGYLRFVVVVFALAVALALGYVKFVRNKMTPPATAGSGGAAAAAMDPALEGRVSALESKMAAVAAVFGEDEPRTRQP